MRPSERYIGMPSKKELDKYAQSQGYDTAENIMYYNGMHIFLLTDTDHICNCTGYPQYFGVNTEGIVEFDVDTNLEIFRMDCNRVHGTRELEKEPCYDAYSAQALLFQAEPACVWAFVVEGENPHVVKSEGELAVESTMSAFGIDMKVPNEEWEYLHKNDFFICVRKDCEVLRKAAMKMYSPTNFGEGFQELCYGLCKLCNKPYQVKNNLKLKEDKKYRTDGSLRTLTRYLAAFAELSFGEIICHKYAKGTWLMPSYEYSHIVKDFLRDVHAYIKENKLEEVHNYQEILAKFGINIAEEYPCLDDLDSMEIKELLAILVAIIDKENALPGQLFAALRSGYINAILQRMSDMENAEQKAAYEEGLQEPLFVDEDQEYIFCEEWPFAIFVGGENKRQGMMLKSYCDYDFVEVLDVYGKYKCLEYLKRLGLSLKNEPLTEGWTRIDMEDGDCIFVSNKPKVNTETIKEFTEAVIELCGEIPFYKWLSTTEMNPGLWKESMADYHATHVDLALYLALNYMNSDFLFD